MVDGREERLVACVGVALSPTGYAQADDVLHDADSAAQRARLLGGSRCEVFDTTVLKIAQSELRLEADFSGAIEREEFFLLYQPIVSLAANQVVGFEALVRWRHPVLGLIAPLEFIPLAERTGFIVPLGQWVLTEACRQLKAWQDVEAAADVWMSVNLSSVQFKRPALVEEISATLRDSGLEPRRLDPGAHREHRDGGPRRRAGVAAAAARHRRAGEPRRLRHRAFVARLPAAIPARLAQSGSLVRPWDREQRRHGEHRQRREVHGAPARAPCRGRGHREGRTAGAAAGARLRDGPGLSLLAADRCRRRRRPAHRGPAGTRTGRGDAAASDPDAGRARARGETRFPLAGPADATLAVCRGGRGRPGPVGGAAAADRHAGTGRASGRARVAGRGPRGPRDRYSAAAAPWPNLRLPSLPRRARPGAASPPPLGA